MKGADELIAKAETKATEQEARANRLAEQVNELEEENATLKRELSRDQVRPKNTL